MIQRKIEKRCFIFITSATVGIFLKSINGYPQYSLPYAPHPLYPPPPPPFPGPPFPGPPMMIGMPAFAIGLPGGGDGSGMKKTTTTSTTTTTEMPTVIGFAIGMPMLPPPPPPMPMPMMPGPPMVLIPVPPPPPPPPPHQGCPESSSREHDCKRSMNRRPGSNWERRSFQRQRNIRARNLRRSHPQPYLSYISNDGDIHYKTRISKNEANKLLDERARGKTSESQEYGNRRQSDKTLRVNRSPDTSNNMYIAPISKTRKRAEPSRVRDPELENGGKSIEDRGSSNSQENEKRYNLGVGSRSHQMSPGKKEIVFNAPRFKKISNVTIAFDID